MSYLQIAPSYCSASFLLAGLSEGKNEIRLVKTVSACSFPPFLVGEVLDFEERSMQPKRQERVDSVAVHSFECSVLLLYLQGTQDWQTASQRDLSTFRLAYFHFSLFPKNKSPASKQQEILKLHTWLGEGVCAKHRLRFKLQTTLLAQPREEGRLHIPKKRSCGFICPSLLPASGSWET